MQKRELASIICFYAISPVHAGAGSSTSVVDLPIQRERHTGWPHIQASSVKGALRQHFRRFATNTKRKGKEDKELINYIFGSDYDNDGKDNLLIKNENEKVDSPGIISTLFAKMLAFPMRSNIAPFVHVTCPSVLDRLKRDLEFCGINLSNQISYTKVENYSAVCLKGGINEKVVLEDVVVEISQQNPTGNTFNVGDIFNNVEKLLLVSDEVFNYCVTNCTEIQTQIKIDSSTGTAKDGSLRYQELLPSDTLLYSVVYFSASAFDDNLQAQMVKNIVQANITNFVQIGGDETLGRGICKVKWVENNSSGQTSQGE